MAKKTQASDKHARKRALKSEALQVLKQFAGEPFNYKQLAARMDISSREDRDLLLKALEEMLVDGQVEETHRGKYRAQAASQFAEGLVDMTKYGSAYIIIEGFEEDVFVQPNKMRNALHGDKVKVMLYAKRKGSRQGGEVVEILERTKTDYTGVVQVFAKYAFVVPDSKRMTMDFFIPVSKLNGAQNGDKVLARILEWPEDAKNPVAEILQVLGKPGTHSAEMNAIIAEFGLPTSFPEEVTAEAEAIPETISEEEIARRWDFRDIPTFTIDPADAKDFDDALSFRTLGDGAYEVGIHIADVSHYLNEGTALDDEALLRATSIYLVDRVIPMLPEKLSNNLCSLRPHEDKLCFSVVVVLDDDAHVTKEWYGRTVIRSQHRYTYEEAQEVLEGGEGPFSHELHQMNRLAYRLRERKFAEGAISFETEEVKFELDENGKPLGVRKKVRKDAHKMIEDYMLLANRKVAEFIFKKNENLHEQPFVYRVHDFPSEEKLTAFSRVASQFGHKLALHNPKGVSSALNRLLQQVEGKPEANMLQSLAIRSMPKAFYTTRKSSHYGLAFPYYTHFTSPIRRYPDVIAHRLLAHYLQDKVGISTETIESQAKHCSEREVKAAEAERASIKYKQVEYMSEHVGEEYAGLISGVTEWGIYVEILENKCEGMVRLSSLKDDFYVFDEERYMIKGQKTGKQYQLGDIVHIKVMATNLNQRTIDLAFSEDDDDTGS